MYDVVIALTAYLDDSGTHDDSHTIVVAGVVAPQAQWDAILQRWVVALGRLGLDSFHASDFSNSKKAFAGLSENDRRSLINDLLSVFADFQIIPVGIGISRDVFLKIQSDEYPEMPVDPYSFCVMEALQHVIYLGNAVKEGASIAVILEDRQKQQSLLPIKHLRFELQYANVRTYYKLASFTIADKKLCRQLELADFIAYELFKGNLAPTPDADCVRYPLKRLMQIASDGRLGVLATLSEEGIRQGMEKFKDLQVLCGP